LKPLALKDDPRLSPGNRAANQPVVDTIKLTANAKNATAAQIAIGWLLARKPWIVPIPGTTKLHRFEENIGAASVDFSEEDLARIDDVFASITINGDLYSRAAASRVVR